MNIVPHFIKDYPVSCLLFGAIWYLSLFFKAPEIQLEEELFIDKWVHFIMYGGTCGVLWLEYIRRHKEPDYEKLFFWTWLAPILMSGVLELLQEYCTETRNGDWLDLAANAFGVTLGAVFGMIVLKYKLKK